MTSKHELYTIAGGPNDGLQIRFKPDGNAQNALIGADEYAVRHHDRVLLFRGYDPETNDAAWNARCQEMVDEFDNEWNL
tara:strand:- start:76 stop:312 length:237 start_codon:yes stop_codon:yes gene_type:complete